MAPNANADKQNEKLHAISAALKSLGIVAGRAGAATFPAEIASLESEITSISRSSLDDAAFGSLQKIAERVAGWKGKYYNEFTTLQNISEYQSMFYASRRRK